MSVPTNLIPTKITGLPEYTGGSQAGFFPYVLDGTTYKVQFSNVASVGEVPPSRTLTAGTGLVGGGDLSANRVFAIANGGVGATQLDTTGVVAGVYGNGSNVPTVTVDANGRVTSVTTSPVVATGYVPEGRLIIAGTGLTGGGSLANNVTLSVNLASATPQALGTATAGVSTAAAREDHVHPAVDLSDTNETQGALPLGRGGTGDALSPVAGAVVYSTGTKLALTNPGTVGQVLVSTGTDEPVWSFVGSGTVISVNASGGTTGMTFTGGPITSSGTLTLGGTLAVGSGGTGVTGTPTNGQLLIGNGTGYALSTLTAGTAVSITNGVGSITIDNTAPDQIVSLTAGTAINVSGTYPNFTVTNTAPDQIVSLTAGTAISVSGTYPNFTVTNTAPDQIVSLTGAGTTSISGTYPNFTITSNDQFTGTVTSVAASGGTTGLTFSGSPITTSGTLTLGGTLAVASGGTGATTASGARTNLGAAASGANSDITSLSGITGGISTADFVAFDTTNVTPPTLGQLAWNNDDGTLDVGLNSNVILQVGQEALFYAKNTSGGTIPIGTPVMFTGVVGASGKLTFGLAVANNTVPPEYMMGVTAQNVPNNGFGYVTSFGLVRGFNTTGAPYGQTWAEGDLLYFDPATPGGWTNVEPAAPNIHVPVAVVVNAASGGSGSIFVRMVASPRLGELQDVELTATPTAGQVLIYDASQSRWENNTLTAGSNVTITNGNGTVTIAANEQFTGTVTSVAASGGTTGLTFSGSPITSSGTLTLGGTLAIGSGGTGASTAGGARTALGAAASGANTDITSVALTSGTILNSPTSGTDIVNKAYADSIASGINFHQSVRLATVAPLPAYTYNNGSSGVGATITANANGALSLDGVAVVAGNRVLIKDEVGGAQAYNGIYTVTQTGSGSTPFILTRATDFDSAGSGVDQIDAGDFFLVTAGNTLSNTSWVQQTPLPITVGTTPIIFSQFGAPVLYSAGTGLTLAGTVFSITNTGVSANTYGSASSVPVIAVNAQGQITSASSTSISIAASQITSGAVSVGTGGTGLTTTPTNGQLLIGNGTGYSLSTLTAGTGVSVTNGSGSVTVTNTAPDQIVTLTGAGATVVTGTYPNFTISTTTGSGTVTSVDVSGGTTGLSFTGGPITSSGIITMGGTLAVANGGTGVTTSTGTGSVVLSNSPTLVTPTLGAASATSIANGLGAVGTPSYTFTGDLNTGIYSPAADTIAFVEGGVEAMRLDSSGRLLVGQTGALNNGTIDVLGTSRQAIVARVTDNVNSLFQGFNSSAALTCQIDGSGNGYFAGNVGIGTTSPSARLHASIGSSGNTLPTNMQGIFESFGNNGIAVSAPATDTGGIYFPRSTVAYYAGVERVNTALVFRNNDAERARITSDGSMQLSVGGVSNTHQFLYNESGAEIQLSDATGNGPILLDNSGGLARLLKVGSGGMRVGTTSTGALSLQTADVERLTINSSGNVTANVDIRAPIFYDSNNTAFYLDPASTSVLNAVNLGGALSVPQNVGINFNGAGSTFILGRNQDGASSTLSNLQLQSWFGIGFGPSISGQPVPIGENAAWIDVRQGDLTARRLLIAGQDCRAPLFYDSQNTAFYLDPASTSVLNTVNLSRINMASSNNVYAGSDGSGWMFGGTGYLYLNQGGLTYAQTRIMARDGIGQDSAALLILHGGTSAGTQINTATRSPIYYDLDNTGFYLDPTGLTFVSTIVTAGNITARGDLIVGEAGVDNASYIYMQDADEGQRIIHCNSNRIGFLTQAGGWGAWCTDGGDWQTDAAVWASIFYDINDSTYYLNLNGYSQVNGNGSVNGSNTTGLNIFSTGGNGAIMAFHRGGFFAVNMGLDSDNVFRIGGWSAGANRLQMDMSGNLTMAGNVTAFSDVRLKKDIETIDGALDLVSRMRGVRFTRIENDERNVGVVAQEMLEVLPEVVQQGVGDDDTLSVAYGNLVGVLIEAIKELTARVAELEGK